MIDRANLLIFDSLWKDNQFYKEPHGNSFEEKALDLFKEIYSYNDLKDIFYRGITSEHNVHILVIGPPATAKSLFLQCIKEKVKDCVYYEAANSTGPGIIHDLVNHRKTRYILIDEIDKINRKDQTVFYNLMETGEVHIIKKENKIKFKMNNPKIFATSNSKERLTKPLKSRFSLYTLPEYSDEDFIKISVTLLTSKFHFTSSLASLIAQLLLDEGEKDVRTVLNIAKLIRHKDDEIKIMKVVQTHLKYQNNDETEFNY